MAKKAKVIRRSEKPKNLIFSPFFLSEKFYPFFKKKKKKSDFDLFFFNFGFSFFSRKKKKK